MSRKPDRQNPTLSSLCFLIYILISVPPRLTFSILVQMCVKIVPAFDRQKSVDPRCDGILGAVIDAAHAHQTLHSKFWFVFPVETDVFLRAICDTNATGGAPAISTKIKPKRPGGGAFCLSKEVDKSGPYRYSVF